MFVKHSIRPDIAGRALVCVLNRLRLFPESSGATDMTLMRHRVRQYGEGVNTVEEMVALMISLAVQYNRVTALDVHVRICGDRLAVSKESPAKV